MPWSDHDPAAWRELNHAWWEDRSAHHVDSDLYGDGSSGLAAFEWAEIGAVDGLDVVHPQCHIGTDTISLARAGARTVGLDFAGSALDGARVLTERFGVGDRCEWIETDVYDAVEAVEGRTFDLVYTGQGALCWLPDMDRWAETMFALTRPGGRLYVSEMHPVQDMMSDDDTDVERSYFPVGGAAYDEPGSYAAPDLVTTHDVGVDFIHPVAEVVQAVIDAGFVLRLLHEHATIVYPRWPWLVRDDDGAWRMPPDRPDIPLMYSLLAERTAQA